MRRSAVVAAALAVVVIQLVPVGPAAADDEPVVVSDPSKLELSVDKSDGSTKVTVINPSARPLTLDTVPIAAGDSECEATPGTTTVAAHTQKAITVAFTGCSSSMVSSGRFTIAKQGAGAGGYLFTPVAAHQESEPDVPWKHMVWFLYSGAGGFLVLVAAYLAWALTTREPRADGAKAGDQTEPTQQTGPAKSTKRPWPKPTYPLAGLESSWTFKESWASNATVIAAAFTGVLGATDVADTILGEESAKSVLAISAVATAVALGLAGTAPMLLQMCRTWTRKSEVTPLGIGLAGVLTIAATGGELGVLVSSAGETEAAKGWAIDLWGPLPEVPILKATLVLGLVLLAVYAFTATQQNFRAGVPEPEKAGEPSTLAQHLKDWLQHVKEKADYELLPDDEKAGAERPTPPPPPELAVRSAFAPERSPHRTAIL